MDYVIVRTYSAGVFAGELESREGKEVVLRNARRLWYWDGAASLSELAMHGEGAQNPQTAGHSEAIAVPHDPILDSGHAIAQRPSWEVLP